MKVCILKCLILQIASQFAGASSQFAGASSQFAGASSQFAGASSQFAIVKDNVNFGENQIDLEIYASFGDFVIYKWNSNADSQLFDLEQDKKFSVSIEDLHFQKSSNHFSTPWHLDRISRGYIDCHTNTSVDIHTYVLDTGIDIHHSQFENRAKWDGNFVDDNNSDCNNHGTHCAGLIGSRSYGVCKDAKIFAIKVLDCEGSGSFSGIIKGLEFVYNKHLNGSENGSNKIIHSILSMSLGGGYSKMLNKAVEKLVEIGIYVVVAAGNENNNACNVSPASAKGVLTVMASDNLDNRAYFSNYGKCADLYAPGVEIISTIPDNKSEVYSGTSMATPIVAGILNYYIDRYSYLNSTEIVSKLMSDALVDKIINNKKNTSNLLAWLGQL
jgi:hypothetical protein